MARISTSGGKSLRSRAGIDHRSGIEGQRMVEIGISRSFSAACFASKEMPA
jgi:hypothetical protein